MLEAVDERLRAADVAWITTVNSSGQPQSSPVWFHWDGATFLVLSQPTATKVTNVVANAKVAIHLDGAAPGTTVVTVEGVAALVDITKARLADYVTKYGDGITRLGSDPDAYLNEFSASIVIQPTRARIFASM